MKLILFAGVPMAGSATKELIQIDEKQSRSISKFLSLMQVDLIWYSGRVRWSSIGYTTIVNKFPYADTPICTKVIH